MSGNIELQFSEIEIQKLSSDLSDIISWIDGLHIDPGYNVPINTDVSMDSLKRLNSKIKRRLYLNESSENKFAAISTLRIDNWTEIGKLKR